VTKVFAYVWTALFKALLLGQVEQSAEAAKVKPVKAISAI
jgi:hypothetical protein